MHRHLEHPVRRVALATTHLFKEKFGAPMTDENRSGGPEIFTTTVRNPEIFTTARKMYFYTQKVHTPSA